MNQLNHEPAVITARKPAPHKYHELAEQLRLLARSLAPGDRMPSVPELMKEYGVAQSTARNAVETLRAEGKIVRRRGSGTFVASRGEGSTTTGLPLAPPRASLAVFALFSNEFFSHFAGLFAREAAAVGLAVECRYADRSLTPADVHQFEQLRPQGFVVISSELDWVAAEAIARGHRAVILGDPEAGATPVAPTVHSDAEQGGYLATRRLLDLGHRRIAYLSRIEMPDLHKRLRWRGHLRALREAGLPASDTSPLIGYDLLCHWDVHADDLRAYFRAPDAPTGVVAWSDGYGAQLIGSMLRAGIQVPREVSVIGYDDLPTSRRCYPALDSVDQHLEMQARYALRLLAAPLATGGEGVATLVRSVVTPTLVERASCALPPA